MRIAFITPEFVSEYANGGGLANYLNRISQVLTAQNHQVEIFVPSSADETLPYGNVLVHRVKPLPAGLPLRLAWRLAKCLRLQPRVSSFLLWYPIAKAIAQAVKIREQETPFDLLQSADFHALGLLVKPRKNRRHIVRSSGAFDLFSRYEDAHEPPDPARVFLERLALKYADRAYAPSHYVADHYRRRHGLHLDVIRPPRALEVSPAAGPPLDLPPRFFLHFGQITRRKGSAHLAQALPLVWKACPDFSMVWAGPISADIQKHLEGQGLVNDPRLLLTGPLPKADLYAVLHRAAAAVLPTLVDNLPNTVIESLMTGTPVIAFNGASIDELVTPGETGTLVPMQDTKALATALIHHWQACPIPKPFIWNAPIAAEMQPAVATCNLLAYAGLISGARRPKPYARRSVRRGAETSPRAVAAAASTS